MKKKEGVNRRWKEGKNVGSESVWRGQGISLDFSILIILKK